MRRFVSIRTRHRDEQGATLVELAVALTLTGILMAIIVVILSMFTHVQTSTDLTYSELNQLTPVGLTFQNLLRTAVSPATNGEGKAPVPPFGHYSTNPAARNPITSTTVTIQTKKFPLGAVKTTTLTFYANTGTPNGPAEVYAGKTPTTTNRFVVEEFFVTSSASPGCPGLTTPTTGSSRPYTDRCTWKTTSSTCSSKKCPRQVLAVDDVVNSDFENPIPIFSYYLASPMSTTPSLATPNTTQAKLSDTPGGTAFHYCPTPTSTGTITECPANNIQSIKVDLEVLTPNISHVKATTLALCTPTRPGTSECARDVREGMETQTVTYQLSTVSQTYSPQVG